MTTHVERKQWLKTLALAKDIELEDIVAANDIEQHCQLIEGPTTAIVTLRGRVGGCAEKFNVGDVCVTKAQAIYNKTTIGYATVMGGSGRKAMLVAMLDAALASEMSAQLLPYIKQLDLKRLAFEQQRRNEAAKTKVDFFTMVRGD